MLIALSSKKKKHIKSNYVSRQQYILIITNVCYK